MTGRTAPLYKAVLERIKEIYREKEGDKALDNIQLMISDYEPAILSSMEEAFPSGRSRGCWFHYGQVRR